MPVFEPGIRIFGALNKKLFIFICSLQSFTNNDLHLLFTVVDRLRGWPSEAEASSIYPVSCCTRTEIPCATDELSSHDRAP